MTPTDNMDWKTYSDEFWGPDFRSVAGAEALARRNVDGKKMCSDFEDYLRKRSKIEMEYSKSLAALTKCFRERESIGNLEAAFSVLKKEIGCISRCHQIASERLQKQADEVKRFKDEQTATKKSTESALQKAQDTKLSLHSKMLQSQKMYVKKSIERDNAEISCKEINISTEASFKDQERARTKAIKTDEDATKADTNYKGAILSLEDARLIWEHEMLHSCQACQELDEERISFLRNELWYAVNVESKMCLDIDDSCERVRNDLQNCDIIQDIQAFIRTSATGSDRPEPLTFQHYTKLSSGSESDSTSLNDTYATLSDTSSAVLSGSLNNNGGQSKNKLMNMLAKKKKKPSASDEHS